MIAKEKKNCSESYADDSQINSVVRKHTRAILFFKTLLVILAVAKVFSTQVISILFFSLLYVHTWRLILVHIFLLAFISKWTRKK